MATISLQSAIDSLAPYIPVVESQTATSYNEIYNAIQNNVISAGENEAAGVESMKFYEVAPNLAMTEHAITIRPICFSTKTWPLRVNIQATLFSAARLPACFPSMCRISPWTGST